MYRATNLREFGVLELHSCFSSYGGVRVREVAFDLLVASIWSVMHGDVTFRSSLLDYSVLFTR